MTLQGQMAICNVRTYCDFVALCVRTQQLVVKRVHFSDAYWRALKRHLEVFVLAALHGVGEADAATGFNAPWPLPDACLRVEDMIVSDQRSHSFRSRQGHDLSWEFLLGLAPPTLNESLEPDEDDAWLEQVDALMSSI